MTTQEAADSCGVARVTMIKWCKQNKIKRKPGVNGISEYALTDKDVEKFKKRRPKGRPKKPAK
jgi:predicted site-specific integrase-resolvase